MTAPAGTLRDWASLLRLSHTVFALPFALLALLVATHGRPSARLLLLVVAAVVAARTVAMAWNRYADRAIDAANPRTRGRELPRGALRPGAVLALTGAAAAAFLGICALLGTQCLLLGVPVLAWLVLYSHSKRFTSLCHLWLGISLGLAPVAAWVAARSELTADVWPAVLLGAGVTFWVAGFDVLYACQDLAFDRAHGLHSVPATLGAGPAFALARCAHVLALAAFVGFGWWAGLGAVWLAGCGLAAVLLVWQHRLLRPDDLGRIQLAFLVCNGLLSVLLLAAGALAVYLG